MTEEPTATPSPTEELTATATATATEEPTATPSPTEEPTATATEEPTATPSPTEEPTATATEEPTATPSPTEEPTATATATATEEPTATSTPLPTATLAGYYGPIDYPEGINPLTGQAVLSAHMERRPLAIKVSNAPPVVVPQHGLTEADHVFEAPAEGGITRLTAIYLGQDAARVGSVRSMRPVDFAIQEMYNSFLAFSGAAGSILDRIQRRIPELALSPAFGMECPPFCRFPDGARAFEHTLFASTEDLWDWANARDEARAAEGEEPLNIAQPLSGLAFQKLPPDSGNAADHITFRYLQVSVEWTYDAEAGLYLRVQNGEPHLDAATETQLGAANVVIIEAEPYEDTPIIDPSYAGRFSIGFDLSGSGRAFLLRDGRIYAGRWVRNADNRMLNFIDANGDAMRFKPGQTWFEITPREQDRSEWWEYWEITAP